MRQWPEILEIAQCCTPRNMLAVLLGWTYLFSGRYHFDALKLPMKVYSQMLFHSKL